MPKAVSAQPKHRNRQEGDSDPASSRASDGTDWSYDELMDENYTSLVHRLHGEGSKGNLVVQDANLSLTSWQTVDNFNKGDFLHSVRYMTVMQQAEPKG